MMIIEKQTNKFTGDCVGSIMNEEKAPENLSHKISTISLIENKKGISIVCNSLQKFFCFPSL